MTSTASGFSNPILAGGIFSREFGQRLLQITVSLGDRGFDGLYKKCVDNTQGNYYQAGLRRVHKWSDTVLQEDIDFVNHMYPDFLDTFETCFSAYVEDRSRSSRKFAQVGAAPFSH